MSNQLYLVMEDDNIQWEGSSWAVAAFDSKEAAEAFAVAHTAVYALDWAAGVANQKLAEAEEAAWPEDQTLEQEAATYDALCLKYPNQRSEWEDRHHFYVGHASIPLNPAA